VGKIDGPPFYQNQIDFWMGNAARLDYIFYRSFLTQTALDDPITRFRSQKKRKVAMKIEPNCEKAHFTSAISRPNTRTQT
jgi:hypothetical protein